MRGLVRLSRQLCRLVMVIASVVVTTPAAAADVEVLEKKWSRTLDLEIARLKHRFKGRISVYTSDPTLGVKYQHDVDKPSYLASGVKVPFMIEVYRQVDQGLLSMDDTLTYTEADVRDGAPRLNKRPFGSKLTIRELIGLMIQSSDNAASDMLVGRVGIQNVNAGLKSHGLDGFETLTTLLDVRRGVFRELDQHADDFSNLEVRTVRWTWGWRAHVDKLTTVLGRPLGTYSVAQLHAAYDRFYETGVNHAQVSSLGHLLEKLVGGTLISAEASAEMLEIMYGSRTSKNRMMGRLPKSARVAHKTGSQWERICDYGVIDLPDGKPLVFAACLAGGNSRPLAERTLAMVARKAYDLAVVAHRDR